MNFRNWIRYNPFVQMKDFALSKGEIITNLRKYIDELKKIFFRATGPISTFFGGGNLSLFNWNLAQIILEWRKSFYKFFKWRNPPFSKRRSLRNSENAFDDFKKNLLLQNQWNLAQIILGWRVSLYIKLDFSNEGSLLFPRGDDYEIVKIH